MTSKDELKRAVCEAISRHGNEIIEIGERILHHPETGFNESETAAVVAERMRTAYTISVDARDGVTTGISAADRARTIRTLADSATEAYEIVRPGHVFPLRYTAGGVLRRRSVPAPGRFSTKYCWPVRSESHWAMMRATMSFPPPGANPTTNRTEREG